jgi:hypothetical protein
LGGFDAGVLGRKSGVVAGLHHDVVVDITISVLDEA